MRFFVKTTMFLIIGAVLLNLQAHRITRDHKLVRKHGKWAHQAEALSRVRHSWDAPYGILGDSVAKQLYPPNRWRQSYASNVGTLIPGQYILAHTLIERQPDVRAVYVLLTPAALGLPFHRKQTYHSFILPFYTFANLDLVSSRITKVMNTNPRSHLAILPYFKITNLVSEPVLSNHPALVPDVPGPLDAVAMQYLERFRQLGRDRNVRIRFVALPTHERYARQEHLYRGYCDQVDRAGLSEMFTLFCGQWAFLPAEKFKDNIHFTKRMIPVAGAAVDERIAEDLASIGISFKPPKRPENPD